MMLFLKLPLTLVALIAPFFSGSFVRTSVAETGFDSTCNASYFQGVERDVTLDQFTMSVYWGRDGMYARCRPQYVGHEFPVVVDIFRPMNGKPDYYNVAWGQGTDAQHPSFTNQHELGADNAGGNESEDIFDTQQTFVAGQSNKNMYAYFRVQSCVRHALGHSRCVSWGREPYIIVELGNKALIRHI